MFNIESWAERIFFFITQNTLGFSASGTSCFVDSKR